MGMRPVRPARIRRWPAFAPRDRFGRHLAALAAALLAAALLWPRSGRAQDPQPRSAGFTNFETEPVRPLALSADGSRLYAVNTADDRLEIFAVEPDGLRRLGEVAVGLRPVAVAVAGSRAWVVNHLSDTLSVVDVADPARARVTHSLPTGDEPRDIVVGGPAWDQVFVASAYRGEPLRPGPGQAQVQVWRAADPARPPESLRLFGRKPRALAVSPDGRDVFAAIFQSGNGSASISEAAVQETGGMPDPGMPVKVAATPPPTGLIVRQSGRRWPDAGGTDRVDAVPFTLPDKDVFRIDVRGPRPVVADAFTAAGTLLFNMAVQPVSGEVWVTHGEALNSIRFEPRLRGRAYEQRIGRLVGGSFLPVSLNAHVKRSNTPGSAAERALSLAQPLDLVFSADGQRAYVAAFQSAQVGVLDHLGRVIGRIPVGFGPAGLALSGDGTRLYVLNHLEASITVVDLAADGRGGVARATVPLRHDPTPPEVHAGRPLLYDAARTSGHGDNPCGGCHVFADTDMMGWDLGDPGGDLDSIPFDMTHDDFRLKPRDFKFHPMKGPMVTQSFRGLAGAGVMHWRGDRHGDGAQATDALQSFLKFRPAFVSLNGLAAEPSEAEMRAFFGFLATIHYPPNPYQNLDRSLTAEQEAGRRLFSGEALIDSGITNCEGCHSLPLGTNGKVNFEGVRTSQDFKAPHLRNVYDKLGRFNLAGDQIAGFGLAHDGSMDTLDHFLQTDVFSFPGDTEGARALARAQVAAYVLAFDTGMAPAVGQQLTLAAAPSEAQSARLGLLATRAAAGDCDLVARTLDADRERGWLLWEGRWHGDVAVEAPLTDDALLAMAARPAGELTFTCVPPGDGPRAALDRDQDGFRNGDELAAGKDPAAAVSHPPGPALREPWAPATPTPDATATALATLASPTPSQTLAATRPPVADQAWLPLLSAPPAGGETEPPAPQP